MQFLEVCSNLVSSLQHNRFKGHFEFGMKALVSKEWSDHGCQVQSVVVRKLCQREEVDPVVLLVVDIYLKILFQDLVNTFSLTISLWMVGSQKVGFDF